MAGNFNDRGNPAYRSRPGQGRSNFARSGLLTVGILTVLLVIFGLYWSAHRRGQFHKLRTHEIPPTAAVPTPGGQEPVVLSRLSLLNNTVPEFVSATLLPGVGMQLLQAMASAPGQDAYPLLQAPTLAQAAAMPPSTLQAAPLHLFVSKSPFSPGNTAAATDIIASGEATSAETETLPDGGQATAKFLAQTGPNGGVNATVVTVLSGHTIDLTVVARNESSAERFVTFEWAPRFAYTDGAKTGLSLPSRQAWRGTTQEQLDFSGAGRDLTGKPIDATYVQLHTEFLADGPIVRLLDRQHGTVLRMTAFNPGVRSLRVHTDPVSHTLMLGFGSFDPTETKHDQIEALHPGGSMQWHLRLEILPQTSPADPGAASSDTPGE